MKKIIIILLFLFISIIFMSCSKAPATLVMDRASVNIATMTQAWPGEDIKLTESEEKAIEEFGRPELGRVWWVRSGDFQNQTQVYKLSMQKKLQDVKLSWLYPEKNIEVMFLNEKEYKTQPMTDKLKLVCDFGDPEDIKKYEDRAGVMKETWCYYSLGKNFIFFDGKLGDTFEYEAIGEILNK